ncbi:Nrap protein [Amniculicola lignicola CBS 123094]|uniref:U3 small nucleolar RNA-associated protein 22 n=1 Tax=Amniculicola lignicola CBS 123094 TaxID=1392246 RepID=A0A6A5WHT0_9PLEO|nr:Nrap protein [Amniculicola lignicola CBS 123094]
MAPPATKRRKLSHSGESSSGEDSFMGFGGENSDAISENGAAGNGQYDSSTENLASFEDEISGDDSEESSEGEREEEEEEDTEHQVGAKKQDSVKAGKPHRNLGTSLQDGVYTSEVYKSNIFKLQVDELLEQVKLKYGKKEAPAENAMRTLKTIIEQLPRQGPFSIPDAQVSLKPQGVTVPFPNPRPPIDAKYKLQYDRPASINATGSYPLKTATRTEEGLTIDMVVTMPKSIFQDKDYLNHRYFYKRAFYLACLAAGIKKSKEHRFKVSFDCLNGSYLQPVLIISPSGNGDTDDFSSSKCRVRIVPAAPEGVFPLSKLLPSSNCIRPKEGKDEVEGKPLVPTPFYNSALQSDASVTSYLKLLHAASGKCDGFQDACILGRIWLQQRGFGGAVQEGGFGNFEWAAVMALLLQSSSTAGSSPLSSGYSSYQLFKATLQFLAKRDMLKTPYSVQAFNANLPKGDTAPIFFDAERGLNLLFKMTPWSYARLQHEAHISMDMLGDSVFDQFDTTFILKADVWKYRYDSTLAIPLAAMGLDPNSSKYEVDLFEKSRKMYNTLVRALTDRVTQIAFTLPKRTSWPITASQPSADPQSCILVNFATDPANANRAVDHGPSAENKKDAAAFRQFWGEKSELRRFKDGSILESLVWSIKDTSIPVLEQIVLHVLQKHVSATIVETATFSSDGFSRLIPSGRIQGQSGVTPFLPCMNAFAQLEKDIRALEGLPLNIRHLKAADAQLRYASIEPPTTTGSVREPSSVVVQFEGSARWPDDLCAIQRTKIAFLLKLSDLLAVAHPKNIARVGLENPSQPSQNQAFLDIILPSGFSFRLRIHHDREATLLDRQLKDKSLDGQSREAAASALAAYNKDFLRIPAHTQVLQSLCTRFPALSPSIRLTKRWFASHLLTPYFAPELIELLVVRTFVQPHPWPIPSCATTSFLRTLAWISRWDWRHVPLVVDLSSSSPSVPGVEEIGSSSLKPEDMEKIRLRFQAWRRIDPAMNRVVLFAATNMDMEGNTWTDKGQPEKVVATRMTALAKAATNAVRVEDKKMVSLTLPQIGDQHASPDMAPTFDPTTLFTPALADFDIIIHIASKHTKTHLKATSASTAKFKNLLNHEQHKLDASSPEIAAVGFDPIALFVADLKSIYGEAVLWFWDLERGDVVAGLWNPQVAGRRGWKVRVGWNSVPVKGGKKEKKGEESTEIELNKEAVRNEILRLGGALVRGVEVVR